MTKPIRNTGPCFHLSLPRRRGQRDVLSHTEFINVHILHALSLPGHPLRVTRKPPTADWLVLLLALPEKTSITINIVPCVKCAPETAARFFFFFFLFAFEISTLLVYIRLMTSLYLRGENEVRFLSPLHQHIRSTNAKTLMFLNGVS